MKKTVLALAMVALTSTFAQAQDKGTEFKFGGEIRQRWSWDNNPAFANSGSSSENNFLQRDMFHVNAISGDKLQAYFSLLHYSLWGQGDNVPINAPAYNAGAGVPGNGTATANPGSVVGSTNSVQIHEAWMWWKISDMISLRGGRQSLDFGDGLVISKNDWIATPFNTDVLMGRVSLDFLDIDLGGGKLADAGMLNPVGGPANTVVGQGTTDSEVDFYGANVSIKNLPDFLKKAEVFLVAVNGDSGTAAGTANFLPDYAANVSGLYGQTADASLGGAYNMMSYGLHVKGDVAMIDYRVDGVLQSGKQKAVASAGQDVTFDGNMIDVEVGYSFPEFMKGRVFVNYHRDSGDDNTLTTGRNGSDHAYQPLFYDRHTYGGQMDFFGFGNLTDIRAGLTLNPADDTKVGFEANILSRTNSSGAYTNVVSPAFSNMFVAPANSTTFGNTSTSSSLGTEFDLWATHNYGHGFTMLGQLGLLTLGDYFKGAGATDLGTAWQFVAQAQYNF